MPSSTENAYLREFLHDRHVACPACQHDLYALEHPSCPHCGLELKLGLAPLDSYRWPWGILITLLSLDAAVGVFFALLVVKLGWPPASSGWMPVFCMFWGAIPLGSLPVVFWRGFYRQSRVAQWAWAGVGVIYTAVAFGCLGLTLKR